jgi:hypothetical protein
LDDPVAAFWCGVDRVLAELDGGAVLVCSWVDGLRVCNHSCEEQFVIAENSESCSAGVFVEHSVEHCAGSGLDKRSVRGVRRVLG